ncbi:MAG TPA: hypothetical protein VF104_07675 [Burkholderiales bacterium]
MGIASRSEIKPGIDGGNALTAIVVPLTIREVSQLECLFFLWGLWALVGRAAGETGPAEIRLILSLDREPGPELEEAIADAYAHYGLAGIFSGCAVNYCHISREENIYVRVGQKPPEKIPPLGLKSGPNTLFFRSLSQFCDGQKTVLLNEVDCFPVRPDWIGRLQRLVAGSEPFWVLGSPYRGWGRLGPEILGHVNGNALYGVGAPGFKAFLEDWERSLAESVKRNPDLAYDIFLSYRHAPLFDPARWGQAPLELFKSLQETLCRIRYTSLIHNLAGEEEISGRRRVDLKSYLPEHPEVTLVHGRFLRRQVLQKALGEVRGLMANGAPARHALGDYLVDASRRLLDRDNLEASKEIMKVFKEAEPEPAVATEPDRPVA